MTQPVPLDALELLPSVRQLALLAASTHDADVLRMALGRCRSHLQLQECAALAPRDLVRLAPQDGSHWLMAARAAADPEERLAALQQAARSTFFGHPPSLLPSVEAAMPADVPAYLRQELWVQALGVGFSIGESPATFALQSCLAGEVPQPLCQSLAEAMAAGAQDLMTLRLAIAIGRRSGWTPERSQAFKVEEEAIFRRYDEVTPPLGYDCQSVARAQAVMLVRAIAGELAGMRLPPDR